MFEEFGIKEVGESKGKKKNAGRGGRVRSEGKREKGSERERGRKGERGETVSV